MQRDANNSLFPTDLSSRRARVLNYTDWKKKMVKEPDVDPEESITPEQRKQMTAAEKFMWIMNSITSDITDEELDQIISVVEKIKSKKKA